MEQADQLWIQAVFFGFIFLSTLFLTVLFLIIDPNGEVVHFPLVPLVICYVMSTLVITPNSKVYLFHLAYFGYCCCVWMLVIWGSSILAAKTKAS